MLCQIVLRLIWFWLSAFLSSSRSDRGSVPESGLELFLWFFVWMSEFPTIVCPEYNICENLLTSVFMICVFFTVESKYLWTQTNRDVCFIQKKNSVNDLLKNLYRKTCLQYQIAKKKCFCKYVCKIGGVVV